MKTTVHNLYPKYTQSQALQKHHWGEIESLQRYQVQTIPSLISNTHLDHLGSLSYWGEGFPIHSEPGDKRAPADFFVRSLAFGWGSFRTLQLCSIWYRILPPALLAWQTAGDSPGKEKLLMGYSGCHRPPFLESFWGVPNVKRSHRAFEGSMWLLAKPPTSNGFNPHPIFSEETELPSTSAAHCTSADRRSWHSAHPFFGSQIGNFKTSGTTDFSRSFGPIIQLGYQMTWPIPSSSSSVSSEVLVRLRSAWPIPKWWKKVTRRPAIRGLLGHRFWCRTGPRELSARQVARIEGAEKPRGLFIPDGRGKPWNIC